MRGVVYKANPPRGMVAIYTDEQGFTIIEVTDETTFEIGDQVQWEHSLNMGGETYRNLTKGIDVDVFVQNHGVSQQDLPQQLLM